MQANSELPLRSESYSADQQGKHTGALVDDGQEHRLELEIGIKARLARTAHE